MAFRVARRKLARGSAAERLTNTVTTDELPIVRSRCYGVSTMTDRLAVIFDVDGVLVDSYQVHFQSWQRVAAEYELELTEDQFAAMFGRTSRENIVEFWGSEQLSEDQITQLDRSKEAAYRELVAVDFPAMDGAVELIRSLYDSGFALAVGSSAPPDNVDLTLEKLGTRALFDAVVTRADVTRGKPDPQVFLIAAERLGVLPKRCAVIEDSPAGITAANAAGMTSIALVSTGHEDESLAAADLRVHSLRELSVDRIADALAT